MLFRDIHRGCIVFPFVEIINFPFSYSSASAFSSSSSSSSLMIQYRLVYRFFPPSTYFPRPSHLSAFLFSCLAGCLFVNINRLADYHEMANIPHQYSTCILKTKAITSYILPAAIVCCFYSFTPLLCPQSCYLSLAETQKPTYLFTHVHFCFNFSIFFCQTIVFLASPFPRRGIKTKLAAAQSPRLWVWQAIVFAPRP